MRFPIRAAIAAALAFPSFACAQVPAERPDLDPAVWVVKDDDTTIYLFGTFHMLDGKADWFNDEVKTAFDSSQDLVVEAVLPENPAEMQPLVLKYAVDPDRRRLSDRLKPETYAKLEAEVQALGLPAGGLDPFEPWFAAMTMTALGAKKVGMTGEHGPEAALTGAARKGSKQVVELEGIDRQLSMFDAMPDDVQIAMLEQTLDQIGNLSADFPKMMATWGSGDVEALVALMNEGMANSPELYRIIFTERNASWAEWIETRLEAPGTVFLAVGAGHLAGPDNVRDLLAKRGIESAKYKD